MKILGIDTSTMRGSAAIMYEGQKLSECISDNDISYSKRLLGMIDKTLKSADLKINDIDGMVVTSGPGSFTGIRIGISMANAFSLSFDKPIIGISSLLAIAESYNTNLEGLVCPVINAKRNEFYFGLYKKKGGTFKKIGNEKVSDLTYIKNMIKDPITFVGRDSSLIKNFLGEAFKGSVNFIDFVNHSTTIASIIAKIGCQLFNQHDFIREKTLNPNYIRRSDAEIKWEQKYS